MSMVSFDHAIVRAPARSVVDGLSAGGVKPSFDGVLSEHAAYVRALAAAGVAVDALPPLEDYPDSVFVEDAALVFGQGAIVLKPGAPTRAGEAAAIAPALAKHFARVLQLESGTVDGGDVLATPRAVFIGRSARTNAVGARALIARLAELGFKGVAVETPPGVLHFKSDCALLDDETVLATARLAATDVFAGLRVVVTPEGEEAAANALRVNDRLFLSAGFARTADLLARAGYKIVALATNEIAKLDAGLSCLSLRWRARR